MPAWSAAELDTLREHWLRGCSLGLTASELARWAAQSLPGRKVQAIRTMTYRLGLTLDLDTWATSPAAAPTSAPDPSPRPTPRYGLPWTDEEHEAVYRLVQQHNHRVPPDAWAQLSARLSRTVSGCRQAYLRRHEPHWYRHSWTDRDLELLDKYWSEGIKRGLTDAEIARWSQASLYDHSPGSIKMKARRRGHLRSREDQPAPPPPELTPHGRVPLSALDLRPYPGNPLRPLDDED